MFCVFCGHEINDSAKFCPVCGAQFIHQDPVRVIDRIAPGEIEVPVGDGVTFEVPFANEAQVQENTSKSSIPVKGPVIAASAPSLKVASGPEAEEKKDIYAGMMGYAIAGFVLSMFGGYSLICAILGIIFSQKVLAGGGTAGLAKAGRIIGIIQVCLGVIAAFFVIVIAFLYYSLLLRLID